MSLVGAIPGRAKAALGWCAVNLTQGHCTWQAKTRAGPTRTKKKVPLSHWTAMETSVIVRSAISAFRNSGSLFHTGMGAKRGGGREA